MTDVAKHDRAAEAAKKLYDLLGEKDQEALRVFEDAVEKENHGSMSDALDLYRKAFKLNDKVDLLYRKTRLPTKVSQLKLVEGKNSGVKLDEDKIKSINVEKLLHSFQDAEPQASSEEGAIKFAGTGANGEDVSEEKPISKLVYLDDDIWLDVFKILLVSQPEAWVNLALTCKKFAYLGFSSGILWKKLCYLIYPNQIYEENQLAIKTYVAEHEAEDESDDETTRKKPFEVPDDALPVPKDLEKIAANYDYSWKKMLNERPFVKFNGCYISVINYFSEGSNEFSSSWTNPVKTVTYYRYLRFYPDGKCLKVLTVMEPYRVVPFLLRYNKTKSLTAHLDLYKKEYVKDGHSIYHGTWTLSTDGELHLVIPDGSVLYQIFHYYFQVKSSGHMHKFNKLNWIRYYGVRKQMYSGDDRAGEVSKFPLRNEKPFRFVKVKSYLTDQQS